VIPVSALRSDVAEAAHALSRPGLVTAYGHVSAGAGASMLITPAAVVDVPLDTSSQPADRRYRSGRPISGAAEAPGSDACRYSDHDLARNQSPRRT
jgi:hypothetical protein